MLSDYYFLLLTFFTCKFSIYLWNIKETELSVGKFIIDIIMIISGISSCLFLSIAVNIFASRYDTRRLE